MEQVIKLPGNSETKVMSDVAVQRSGNTLWLINVVTLRQARLVPRWVTVFGQVNHLGAEAGTQAYSAGACSC